MQPLNIKPGRLVTLFSNDCTMRLTVQGHFNITEVKIEGRKKVKGKAVPLQAWISPEGSRKLRFPDFVTTAQDGGRLSALRTGRLYPRKYSWYSFLLEAESIGRILCQ